MLWRCWSILFALLITPAGSAAPLHSNPLLHPKLYLDSTTYPWTAADSVIEQVWRIVSDLYKPFAIDVTTAYPGVRADVAWIILGGPLVGGHGGDAGIGNYPIGITDLPFAKSFAGLVYADGLGNDPALVGRAAAHEAGHLLGLLHQSYWLNGGLVSEYNDGDGLSVPIMGNLLGHLDLPAVWTVGPTPSGLIQDDAAVIGAVVGLAPEPPALVICLGMIFGRRGRR